MYLPFNLCWVDRMTYIMCSMNMQYTNRTELRIYFNLGKLCGKAIGGIGYTLTIGIKRYRGRVKVSATNSNITSWVSWQRL